MELSAAGAGHRAGTMGVKLLVRKKEITYDSGSIRFLLALTISSVWIGVSAAQQPMAGHVLRVFTTTVSPDKRDQQPKTVADITQLLATTKGILWFRVGSDPATREYVAVTL